MDCRPQSGLVGLARFAEVPLVLPVVEVLVFALELAAAGIDRLTELPWLAELVLL